MIIKLKGSEYNERINFNIIQKLYNLVFSNDNRENWEIEGYTSIDYVYQRWIDYLENLYDKFSCSITRDFLIWFEDKYIENILIEKLNLSLNGVPTSYKIDLTDLYSSNTNWFENNTHITKFNELQEFKNVTTLRTYSFYKCAQLIEIDLSNIARIEHYAFKDCVSLTSLGHLSKCNYIGHEAFYGCSSLTSIDLSNGPDLMPKCFMHTALILTNNDLQNIVKFEGTRDNGPFGNANDRILLNIETLNLPNCEYLGDTTFVNQTNIKHIILENVKTLKSNKTFYKCTQLIDAVLKGTYTKLGGDWGYGGFGMFEDCTNLTTVELSSSLTKISYGMFKNCPNLTTINFNDFQENITIFEGESLTKSNNITHKVFYLPRCTLFGCINEGDGTAYAKKGEFFGIDGFSFYLPKITEINESSLANNDNNKKGSKISYFGETLYMPYRGLFTCNETNNHYTHSIVKTLYFKNLETVQAGVFAGFTVDIIIFNNVTPPTLKQKTDWIDTGDGDNGICLFNDDMFRTTIINDGIYVPDSAVQTYKNTPCFSNVIDKIKPLSTCQRITVEQGMSGVSGLIEAYMNEK